jgi:adenosylcobyric acid synthase
MIQGCTSDAGKSLITTALCRWYSSQGVMVAPFKAQNMSNNARVVSGGEIGVAQWLQAKAARVEPDVRMNPILLKPQSDTFSQVITLGKADLELTKSPWQGRSQKLWPIARQALHELVDEYELVIIEGAGSPAEINLKPDDYINMRVAKEVGASVLLTVDIDRGGAFAHLLGTWNLLDQDERELIDGFILNKFRGDAGLLAPAPDMIETLTGIQTRAVIPYLKHRLPSEEGPSVNLVSSSQGPRVYIVCGPYSSNLDEFHLLQSSARVTFVNMWRLQELWSGCRLAQRNEISQRNRPSQCLRHPDPWNMRWPANPGPPDRGPVSNRRRWYGPRPFEHHHHFRSK